MAAKIMYNVLYTYRRTPADSLDFECGTTPSGIVETLNGRRARNLIYK